MWAIDKLRAHTLRASPWLVLNGQARLPANATVELETHVPPELKLAHDTMACDVVHSSDLVDHEADLPHTGDAHDALRRPSVLA
ncbi:hypothetical protein T492DRAFT_884479 [Pavlovales sp. CCMP2436]|nr:hypothetical protein T492DRAFT_884479 [Pavlovales sp. CCMP2436]